jgi:hypothetical protein
MSLMYIFARRGSAGRTVVEVELVAKDWFSVEDWFVNEGAGLDICTSLCSLHLDRRPLQPSHLVLLEVPRL